MKDQKPEFTERVCLRDYMNPTRLLSVSDLLGVQEINVNRMPAPHVSMYSASELCSWSQ